MSKATKRLNKFMRAKQQLKREALGELQRRGYNVRRKDVIVVADQWAQKKAQAQTLTTQET